MAQELTREKFLEMVENTSLKAVKEHAPAIVAEAVTEALRKALEPVKKEQSDWMTQIVGGLTRPAAPIVGKVREKGAAFGRFVRAVVLAKREGSGEAGLIRGLTESGDKDIADAYVETKALAASTATAGGYLVPEQFSQDVLEFRRAATVVRGSGPRIYPMPTGTFHLPKVTGGVTGSYSGENANATHSNPTFGENILSWKKLTVTSAVSNDLLRYASPAADAIVRDDVVRSLSVTEDVAFIRADGTGGQPKGLRYWAASGNIFAAATASLANASTDMGKHILNLLNNNVPSGNWGWIFSPRTWHYLATLQNSTGYFSFREEMIATKTFYGFPFKVSTSVPITLTVGANSDTSEIYFANFDDVAIGDSMRLAIDLSSEAAYYNGSSVVSAFSLDQSVIRGITEHDLAVRDENAVSISTGVRWGV